MGCFGYAPLCRTGQPWFAWGIFIPSIWYGSRQRQSFHNPQVKSRLRSMVKWPIRGENITLKRNEKILLFWSNWIVKDWFGILKFRTCNMYQMARHELGKFRGNWKNITYANSPLGSLLPSRAVTVKEKMDFTFIFLA